MGCEALTKLQDVVRSNDIAVQETSKMRTFDVWQADLFSPPQEFLAAPEATGAQFLAFSYSNCFGDDFIHRIMQTVAQLPHRRVRLMISKLLKDESRMQGLGLKRVKNPGIHT